MSASAAAPSAPPSDSEPVDLLTTPHSLSRAVYARRSEYTRARKTKIKIGTWNVAACPGTDKDLARWFVDGEGLDNELVALSLADKTTEEDGKGRIGQQAASSSTGDDEIGLYVLGLQEIVDLNLTKEYMTRAVYTDNSATEKWQAALEAAMPEGYELVVSEQMFGMLLLIYASPELAPTVGNVSTKQVGTGMYGWFANKGAVTTRLTLGEATRLVFVNCHLASGATPANMERRIADAKQIVSKTQFDALDIVGLEDDEGQRIGDEDFAFWFGDLNFRLDSLPGDDIRRILTLHTQGEYDLNSSKQDHPEGEGVIVMRSSESDDDTTTESSLHSGDQSFDTDTSLPDPDDFPEDPSQDPASLQATLDSLLPHDQLRKVIQQRKAFHDGWKEGPLTFLPTYKYDVGTVGLFDSSEKKRAPSWCDRILYRTRKAKEAHDKKAREEEEAKKKDDEMKSRGIEDDDDVLFTYDPEADGDESAKSLTDYDYDEYDEAEDPEPEVAVVPEGLPDGISVDLYTSHQRITSSDHKPISSVFSLEYNVFVPELKSHVHAEVARELDRAENEGRPGITLIAEGGQGYDETAVDLGEIQFLQRKTATLTVANTGSVSATFSFAEKPTPDDEEDSDTALDRTWISTHFSSDNDQEELTEALGKNVTLEPGETVTACVTAQITSLPRLRALNDGSASVEDVLILRVEDGRDHFIPTRGTWLPSCFGRSVDELIRVPDGGIRDFVRRWGIEGSISYDAEQKFSAPQELFKITTAMEDLAERCVADEAMLGDSSIPSAPGWPLDPASRTATKETLDELCLALVTALDTAKPLSSALPLDTPSIHKLEAMSSILMLFLTSLTDGVIPYQLWLQLGTSVPNITSSSDPSNTKLQILDALTAAPTHNIAFVFLTTALSRVAAELTPAVSVPPPPQRRLSFRRANTSNKPEETAAKKRLAKQRRFAEIVAPAVCRSQAGSKDKATRERERLLVEICLRPDDG